jgi:hypothetical protein
VEEAIRAVSLGTKPQGLHADPDLIGDKGQGTLNWENHW